MRTFSAEDRLSHLQNLEDTFDLLIVGGGITGAGVARDAASRGMKVALVEKNDFAFGASSRSTKLIHGGLRYLENLEFGLVFEALSERQKLFEIAPHLVHPTRFLLPIYDDSRVGMFKMGCGMWLYDLLAMFRGGSHEQLDRGDTLQRIPFLKSRGLLGSYVYSDAYMDDDRLVLETLRSANEMAAICLNYVSAEAPVFLDGKINGLKCKDRLTGRNFSIRAKHVVSTVGPWTDIFAPQLLDDWKKLLKPSKGIHLTLDHDRFPVENSVVLTDDEKGRIVFAIPRDEMVVVGTTDTAFNGDPSDVSAQKEDVIYLNNLLNEYFPEAKLEISDYISSYAGVRPLVDTGTESVGKTSREHTILSDARGVTFVAGGKYTTYRKMAEEIVDHTLPYFSLKDLGHFQPSQTSQPINPFCTTDGLRRSRQAIDDSDSAMSILWRRHGEECFSIRKRRVGVWAAEADFAIENTMCLNLLDFYTRRSPLFLAEKDQGLSMVNEVVEVFAESFKWNKDEIEAEINSVRKHVLSELSWKF